jgi:hypothetical protein
MAMKIYLLIVLLSTIVAFAHLSSMSGQAAKPKRLG